MARQRQLVPSVSLADRRAGQLIEIIANSNKTPLIFIEGITSDPQGNLYIVDIPYGQIFHLDVSTRKFTLVKQYGGEPNGMAVREDGMLIVADHKEGLVRFL